MGQLIHLVKLELESCIRKFLIYSNLESKNYEEKMLLTEQKIMVINSQKYPLRCSSREVAIMKVRICPDCGERWWCVKCGYCHWCHPDFEPPAGVAVKPLGGSPTLPSQAVSLL